MTTHSKLSPSSRHRWQLCPGSVREEAKYPDPPSGPAAIDGTHTHTLFETCIKMGLVPAASFIGMELSDHDGLFKVDAERAERVQFALDYVMANTPDGVPYQIISERRVDPYGIIHRDDLSGTVDCQIVTDDYIEVIDYKDGMDYVEATGNPQLEQYVVGAVADYKDKSFKRIKFTIIQPKLRLKGKTGIESSELLVEDFMSVVGRIMAEAAATDDPDAPLVPGDVQCKYCAVKGNCLALSSKALTDSGIKFENISQQAADKDPAKMDDSQIRQILEAGPLVRQMLEGVEAEALRRLEAGHTISGIKLVKGRGTRAWMFDEEKTAEILKKMGIPKTSLYKTTLISPAQAEKVTWEKKGGIKGELTPAKLKTLQNEYIKKSDGKLTVALDSDERPAVNVSVTGMFEPVVPAWLTQS